VPLEDEPGRYARRQFWEILDAEKGVGERFTISGTGEAAVLRTQNARMESWGSMFQI
jgi:hypothetical protein